MTELTHQQEEELLEMLIGMTKKQAIETIEANGYTARITREDDNGYMVTCDFRLCRINLVLEKGLVLTASVG